NTAETLAIMAFSFLMEDDERRRRFLDLTGTHPDQLREALVRAEFQAAILDYLGTDERILAAFATGADLDPADIERARTTLAGRRWERDGA
ncbi:MAG: DUF3572 family protein, partial [Variibacter sp.]